VKQNLHRKHRQRIENIHEHFMTRKVARVALCEFDDAEDAARNDDDGGDG
jgi:hypothetical protein